MNPDGRTDGMEGRTDGRTDDAKTKIYNHHQYHYLSLNTVLAELLNAL